MTTYGYARGLTDSNDYMVQHNALKGAGCDIIRVEREYGSGQSDGPGLQTEAGRITSHGRATSAPAMQHEVGLGAQILRDLGLHTIRLLTNHPRRIVALEGFGIRIVEQVAIG